eukprot:44522-Eustigmatos_ZCMA.PRE.1
MALRSAPHRRSRHQLSCGGLCCVVNHKEHACEEQLDIPRVDDYHDPRRSQRRDLTSICLCLSSVVRCVYMPA